MSLLPPPVFFSPLRPPLVFVARGVLARNKAITPERDRLDWQFIKMSSWSL